MRWNKNKSQINTKPVFDIELPEMDLSIDTLFTELKTELKEEKQRNTKKVKKRAPPKAKQVSGYPKPKVVQNNIAESVVHRKIQPPSAVLREATPDPLALVNTPKYMTQQEFQNHYRLLLDRIQIQLGSLGGGGAVNIRDMDDVNTAFITDPESLDGAVMRMQYNPNQKVLQFYGDNSFVFNNRSIVGTTDQINIDLTGERFNVSLPNAIVTPGTMSVTGITTLAASGDETHTGGNIIVNGTAKATKFSTTSDERLKTNIKKIDKPLDIINKIEGVTYNWISDNSADVGVIAQDVERCLPDAVQEMDGIKSVNYNALIGLLVESVKELTRDNRLLKLEIENLKPKN